MVLNNNGNVPMDAQPLSVLHRTLGDSGDYVNIIDDQTIRTLEWPVVQQQRRTASVERMEPTSKEAYFEAKRPLKGDPAIVRQDGNSHTLPRDANSRKSREFTASTCSKPIPKPRCRLKDVNQKVMSVSATMERDSLDVSTASFVSPADVALGRVCKPEAASGDHNGRHHLETQLHALAQSCFFPASPKHSSRDSSGIVNTSIGNGNGTPRKLLPSGRNCSQRTSPPISVPVFCVYSAKERMTCQQTITCDSSGDNSSSQRSSRDARTNSGASSSNTTGHARLSLWTDQPDARSSSDASQHSKGQHSHQGFSRLDDGSSSEDDYAVPPDATDMADNLDVRCVIKDGNLSDFITSTIEKSGYLLKLGSRSKTWKRRWFLLRDDQLQQFKCQEDQECKSALSTIQMSEIISLTRTQATVSGTTTEACELSTAKKRMRLAGEDPATTDDWFQALSRNRKDAALRQLHPNTDEYRICGWLTKVHFGRSKRFWCTLNNQTLLLHKRPSQRMPVSQINLASACIKETPRSSEDESETEDFSGTRQYSLEIRVADGDAVYLLFGSCEEKEKWLFHLTVAAAGGAMQCATPFEKLISKLMDVEGDPESALWHESLMTSCEERPTSSLTRLDNESAKKTALNLYKSVYLFSTAPVHGCAVEYHVDLAQNILQNVLSCPDVKDELLCQLIKFTNSNLLVTQTWRLLSLTLSLYTPMRYPVLWLLRKHLHRKRQSGDPRHRFAAFCRRALDRCIRNGVRKHAPSRLEVMAFLTRDPCEHSMPHSIPVHLPDGSYQVVGFDGSSTVEECQQRVCQMAGLRSPRVSGYVIYADAPQMSGTLQPLGPKDKFCDVLSRWEKNLREVTSGKIPTSRSIQLQLLQRYYWQRFLPEESDNEKLYAAYQACDQVRQGRVPVTMDLSVEFAASMAQLHYGPCKHADDTRVQEAILRTVPEKLVTTACRNTLRQRVIDRWLSLRQSNAVDCATAIVGALRLWPYYGAKLFDATIKWKSEEPVWMAVSEQHISVLHSQTFEPLFSYSYETVMKFGGMKNDFVLVVLRTSHSCDESAQERLVFGMDKPQMYEATMLIADYIKNRRSAHVKQSCTFSPRR